MEDASTSRHGGILSCKPLLVVLHEVCEKLSMEAPPKKYNGWSKPPGIRFGLDQPQ